MANITAGRGILNGRDFIRGLYVAVLSSVLPLVYDSIESGFVDINWTHIWKAAAVGGVGYLMKNILSPSEVVISDKATVQAAKDGETITITPKPN